MQRRAAVRVLRSPRYPILPAFTLYVHLFSGPLMLSDVFFESGSHRCRSLRFGPTPPISSLSSLGYQNGQNGDPPHRCSCLFLSSPNIFTAKRGK